MCQKDFARELTQRYNRDAGAYRELWAPILRKAGQKLIPELAGSGVRRILDVGTGVGTLLTEFRDAFPDARIVGIDRSPGMLALAPLGFDLAVMDATRLAVAPASVDLALLVFMLFHLENPQDALRKVRRILRPGGRMGSTTWGEELQSPASRIWANCLDLHGATPADPESDRRHEAVNTPAKMRALLETAGFESVRTWVGELIHPLDRESLLLLKTGMGASRLRFESLAPAARTTCLEQASGWMHDLSPEDFVMRAEIVYAVANT